MRLIFDRFRGRTFALLVFSGALPVAFHEGRILFVPLVAFMHSLAAAGGVFRVGSRAFLCLGVVPVFLLAGLRFPLPQLPVGRPLPFPDCKLGKRFVPFFPELAVAGQFQRFATNLASARLCFLFRFGD